MLHTPRLVDEARCEIADAVVAIQKLVATGAEQVAWHSMVHSMVHLKNDQIRSEKTEVSEVSEVSLKMITVISWFLDVFFDSTLSASQLQVESPDSVSWSVQRMLCERIPESHMKFDDPRHYLTSSNSFWRAIVTCIYYIYNIHRI